MDWIRRKFSKDPKPIVVGICGASRSGKTTLTNELLKILPQPHFVIQLDHFFSIEAIQQRQEETGFKFPNWEEPAAIDWNSLRKAIKAEVFRAASIPSGTRPVVIVEGFLLFAQPLVAKFERSVFVCIDEETAKRRRFETKRVPDGYFESLIWPSHLENLGHLLQWKEAGNAGPLGDILVLDGTREDPAMMAQKTMAFIRGEEVAGRDQSNELVLLRKVFGGEQK